MEETFNDQPIIDSIKQYDEIRKISTGQGDNYTTGCLLNSAYFEKNYKLIAADLNKQKGLDVNSKAIQQIIFTGKIKSTKDNTRVIIFLTFLNNQKKQCQNSPKEKQKCCNYI